MQTVFNKFSTVECITQMYYQMQNINMRKPEMTIVKKISIKLESVTYKKRKTNWDVDRKKIHTKQINNKVAVSKRIKQLKNTQIYQIANEIDRVERERKKTRNG